jgi:hypothetical protein
MTGISAGNIFEQAVKGAWFWARALPEQASSNSSSAGACQGLGAVGVVFNEESVFTTTGRVPVETFPCLSSDVDRAVYFDSKGASLVMRTRTEDARPGFAGQS